MIHPDYSKFRNVPAVSSAAADYRAAHVAAAKSGAQHAGAWIGVKRAESALNEAVERQHEPRQS